MRLPYSLLLTASLLQKISLSRSFLLFSSQRGIHSYQLLESTPNKDTDALLEESPPEQTVDSLRILLKKQRADLQATKELLASVESNHKESHQNELSVSFATSFDYGFVSRSEGGGVTLASGDLPGYGPPKNVWSLGWEQFFRNLNAMKGEYKDEEDKDLDEKQLRLQMELEKLTLDSDAIWEREKENGIEGPLLIKIPYLVLCWFLDAVFEDKYVFSRFFLLETVARMPYFSYITMIHLYETLGFWRRSADIKRIHFAEELNEFHHLQIAESLGGDQEWYVRFMAQHAAIVYYIVLCILWLASPSLSYEFSRLLETHAVNTYGQFLDENEEALKTLPPSVAAVEYYAFGSSDPFYAEFQLSSVSGNGEVRRPGKAMESLYDVFEAIKADEGDHVTAMKACLDPNVALVSPSIERRFVTGAALAAIVGIAGAGSGTDGVFGGEMIDSALAGGAALFSNLLGDNPSPETVAGAQEVFEGVTMENIAEDLAAGAAAVAVGISGIFDNDDNDEKKSLDDTTNTTSLIDESKEASDQLNTDDSDLS